MASSISATVKVKSAMAKLTNSRLLDQLKEGDLVEFPRGLFSHWGVYVGGGMVVHLSGDGNDEQNGSSGSQYIGDKLYNKARVCKESFLEVAGDSMAKINNSKDKYWRSFNPEDIVIRALDMVGDEGYNVIHRNCEQFAKWCRYNKAESEQVQVAVSAAVVGSGVALTLTGLALLGRYLFGNKNETEEEKRKK